MVLESTTGSSLVPSPSSPLESIMILALVSSLSVVLVLLLQQFIAAYPVSPVSKQDFAQK